MISVADLVEDLGGAVLRVMAAPWPHALVVVVRPRGGTAGDQVVERGIRELIEGTTAVLAMQQSHGA